MASLTTTLPFEREQTSRAVLTLRHDIDSMATWEQWYLLSADHHWDNPDSDHAMIRRHLAKARERNAGVLVFGDLFCMMQGKYDKRSNKAKVRPEHQVENYIDAVINTAADFYGEYADIITLIATGNHETGILKNHETNVTERLVERINALHQGKVTAGGYGGWVRFMFQRDQQRMSRKLKYFHGSGGGGPVTRGVIQTNRQAVYLPDADIVVGGHTHDEWIVPIRRERISNCGVLSLDYQWHVRCPTYKDEYKDGYGGWHIETGKPPKPTGAVWLRWFWDGINGLSCEFTPAK